MRREHGASKETQRETSVELRRQELGAALPPLLHDGRAAARAARLSYASEPVPGMTRRRMGRGFRYHDAKGRRITRPSELERIARLARIVRRCRDLPGQRLFQYEDGDGQPHAVTSGDVNDYLRRVTGEPFSAKDFRTWSGTLLALHELDGGTAPASEREARRGVRQALEQVSAELGNTVSVCRKSYVHPLVIDQYARGELHVSIERARRAARRAPLRGLREIEAVALHWLRGLPARPLLGPPGAARPRAARQRAAP